MLTLTGGLCMGHSVGLASATTSVATSLMAPAAPAAPAAQRGRSGGKPRSQKGQPSTPRGIGQPKAQQAIRRSGGSFGVSSLNPDRASNGTGGRLDDPNNPVFGHPPERQQRLWFSIADDDSSGWVSFREAAASMRFDAPRFCVFDLDNDGRITYEEFNGYVVGESSRNRRIIAPVVADFGDSPRKRSSEQLRAAYDSDLDGAISRFEFETILRDYDQEAQAFDTNDVFVRLDANDSKTLEIDELGRLASFLNPLKVGRGTVSPVMPGASTVLDLFGELQDMGDAHPPRIVGPVPPFRRLDLNNDGFVDIEDLERLEGRSFNPVRLRSVLNTLDIDYDGRLSEAEFLSSMVPRRRRSSPK